MTEERKLYITNTWVVTLFIYYLLIFVVGILSSVFALIPELLSFPKTEVMVIALIGSLGMACTGSSIFYIRKLYKLCFKDHININNEENTYLKRLGTIVYFLARPVFSLGFAILIVIGLQSGFIMATNTPIVLDTGFIYMTMFISFFIGFLSGRFVKQLEESGKGIINKVSN